MLKIATLQSGGDIMPINVYWHDNNKKILRCDFIGDWDWDEYDAMVNRGVALAGEVPHDISIISDVSRSARMPKGNGIQHLRRTKALMPHNVKATVTAGRPSTYASSIMGAFLKVYTRNAKLKMMLASSVDEALAMVEKQKF